MEDRIDYLLEKYFIQDVVGRTQKRIGVEVELPVVRLNKEPLETEFALSLMEHMQLHGFMPVSRTAEGYCYEAKNESGDILSFDTTWNIIEFSIKQEISVTVLASRFYSYITSAQQFAKSNGYVICGRGLHPYAEHIDITPLHTSMLTAKSKFLRQFTTHHDGDVFFSIPASTQTHIDCLASEYFDVLNFLRSIIFIDTCLFANSLPPAGTLVKKHPVLAGAATVTNCYRDEIYRLSEAPNTVPDDKEIHSFAELKEYLRKLSVFIVTDEKTGFRPIEPVPFERYFLDGTHPEEDIACFRPLEPVSVSKYGTFELRGTCTQPLSEIFQPTAFYTGLVEMREQASSLLNDFFEEQRVSMSPMELRRRIAQGEAIAEERAMQSFLKRMVSCAYDGLLKRGHSEEKLMHALYESKTFQTPAQRELALTDAGVHLSEIVHMLGDWQMKLTAASGGVSIIPPCGAKWE